MPVAHTFGPTYVLSTVFLEIRRWFAVTLRLQFLDGSNMIFYALTSAGHRGRCWKARVSTPPERPSRCYCIRKSCLIAIVALKHFFSTRKLWRKCFEKFFFIVPIMARKSTLPANVLKTPLPGQIITSRWRREIKFATVHAIYEYVRFCNGTGLLMRKTTKPCINSTWIALFKIHGFVPFKTWLLIACDTAFYAINWGSYMSAHILLKLLNGMGEKIRCEALPSILSVFPNEFNINSIIQEH